MKPLPRTDDVEMIDLESSSQIEMDRTFGCDSDLVDLDPDGPSGVTEPHHRRSPSEKRELLQNPFPSEG